MTKSTPFSGNPAALPAHKLLALLAERRVWIMGVLNATPDSFYDGSRSPTGLSLAERLIEEGADIMDIGGESTRPGAGEVPLQEELGRLIPVLDVVRARWPEFPISIDTQKGEVAGEALSHGAHMINDISALRHDPGMAEVIAGAGCPVVLMHMQGTPQTMQVDPHYGEIVSEVKAFFEERMTFAVQRGIPEERIILDPGIGFGKTRAHNLALLRYLPEFLSLGRPLLIGASRKSFIGESTPDDRLEGSLAAALWAVQRGALGLRVHDVGSTRKALQMWEALNGTVNEHDHPDLD